MEEIGLTQEQQAKAIEVWNANKDGIGLQELGEQVFGKTFNIRSVIGKKLKAFIASRNVVKKVEESNELELTEEQKLLVIQNIIRLPDLLDLTQFVFPSLAITDKSKEYLAIKKYTRTIRKTAANGKESESYKAPGKTEDVIPKINKATFNNITRDKVEKEAAIRTNVNSLVKFLNSFRFGLLYESFSSDIEKELFESTFIKYTWDKPDLTEEEVDQYINLACDIVSSYNLKKELEFVTTLRDGAANDSDGKKISMSLVESMMGIRKEIDDNLKRQDRSISTLQGKRSSRIDMKIRENSSILQIVAAWRNAENRKRFINLANLRKQEVKKELEKLDTMESLKAEIWGLNPDSFEYTPADPKTVISESVPATEIDLDKE